ncbi:MAG: LapA family protein [Anaerolineae bacterium]|nr:MAG: LapA family protein [Anaerolineae bacterium]
MLLFLIIALVLAVAGVVFALQNPAIVQVSFFNYSTQGSLALFVLIALALGVVIGVLVMSPAVLKRSLTISSLRRRIKKLEKAAEEQEARRSEEESASEPSSTQAEE